MVSCIIYCSSIGKFVSSYENEFLTSEWPEDYLVFPNFTDARKAVEYIISKYGLDEKCLEIEEF